MEVRVRCAPSPTGYLHVGVTRAALFNYLYARHNGGKFLVRIEDTDRERSRDDYTQSILEGLEWVGLVTDEAPIFQSQRLEYYKGLYDRLIAEGHAYYCDCSKERLDLIRSEQQAAGKTPRYDDHCRNRTDVPATGSVIRLKTPGEGSIVVDDPIYGRIEFQNADVDDYVIVKSDGIPTYQFAVVADDHAQGVTIVIRGNDLLPSTPKQILLNIALGWEPPHFAHLPMILGADKQKLSKRHGATSLLAYRAMGYLPQAMVNYLVRLGWSHGDQEVFSMAEMIEHFSIDAIGKSPAVFNPEKLLWLNGEHIRLMSVSGLTDAWLEHLRHLDADQVYLEAAADAPPIARPSDLVMLTDPANREWVESLVTACQERSTTLVQITEYALPFLEEEVTYDAKAVSKVLNAQAVDPLNRVMDWLKSCDEFPSEEAIHDRLTAIAEELQLGLGKVAQPIRVALTGKTVSPPINTTLAILAKSRGRDCVIARLTKGIELAAAAATA